MWGTWSRPAFALGLLAVSACGAADNRVDPADLTLRDLLGLAPRVAQAWDDDQRAAARHVIDGALDDGRPLDAASASLAPGRTREERIARTLAVVDGDRAGDGAAALALVRVAVGDGSVTSEARRAGDAARLAIAGDDGAAPSTVPVELWLAPAWDTEPWGALPGRGMEVLGALASDAGHAGGPVVIVPSPRLAVAAAYVARADEPAQLLVNPVLLAALEPDPLEGATVAGLTRAPAGGAPLAAPAAARAADDLAGGANAPPAEVAIAGTGGNPYAWYGSVAECAYVQRTRCESCLPSSSCTPVTELTDGNAECTMLAAGGGRGYFLLCINLSLAIASVDSCTADEAPSCPRDPTAGGRLSSLDVNANFLDDQACADGLDRCLADIYGAPPNPFPGTDGGTAPPDPPRDINVSCGDSCNDNSNNGNCEASPSCSCSNDSGGGGGPSCGNAFSCDSACSSSNEQSGCGGNCEACNASGDSGGSTSSGCGGCESDGSSSGGGGSCDSCSSDSGGSSGGGGSCDSCSSDSGGTSSGGSCGGDSCGGGGGGGGCGGGGGGDSCGGGGGGSGSCNVARRGPPTSVTLFVAGLWGLLPVPAALLFRRKARRKQQASKKEVV